MAVIPQADENFGKEHNERPGAGPALAKGIMKRLSHLAWRENDSSPRIARP